MANPDELQPAWTLILPAGSEWATLRALARGLAPEYPGVRVTVADGVPPLPAPTPRGRWVVDAQALLPDALAALREFLEGSSGWELVLLDRTGEPTLARELVGPQHVAWWPGPIRLNQATFLLEPPRLRDVGPPRLRDEPSAKPAPAPLPMRPSPGLVDADAELGVIRAILNGGLGSESAHAPAYVPTPSGAHGDPLGAPTASRRHIDRHPFEILEGESEPDEPDEPREPQGVRAAALEELDDLDDLDKEGWNPFEDDAPLDGESQRTLGDSKPASATRPTAQSTRSDREADTDPFAWEAESTEPTEPTEFHLADPVESPQPVATQGGPLPTWYRDQIADLSDLAQRLHLDLFALEEGQGIGSSAYLSPLREDIARLTQFTRTLGFLAAPPGPGHQTFSLPTLVQEQMGALAGLGPEAPRFLFRSQQDVSVRSDKGGLVGALDAILQVAGQCAGPYPQTVRVECSPWQDQGQIAVRFAPGPLAGIPLAEMFTPYRLRESLPSIGPNALGAARSIVQGQGGSLTLEREAENTYAFLLRLPRVSI
ncbi:MAG: HAMP domain-containing histidine kinase [Planctomycetes bacterium]|nr:HAMP domain-containing histidine kinase [Planctomycetota bacterium]